MSDRCPVRWAIVSSTEHVLLWSVFVRRLASVVIQNSVLKLQSFPLCSNGRKKTWRSFIHLIILKYRNCNIPATATYIFYRNLIIPPYNKDRHKKLRRVFIWPYCTSHVRVSCPWVPKKIHIWPCPGHSAYSFDGNIYCVVGIQDGHRISDKFEAILYNLS